MMIPIQEAYAFMQEQPADNIQLVIDILRAMVSHRGKAEPGAGAQVFRRTGLAKAAVDLPEDFDEYFDEVDKDLANDFYEERDL